MNDCDTVDDKYNLTDCKNTDGSFETRYFVSYSGGLKLKFPIMAFTAFSDETLHMQIVNINE